MDNIGMCIGMYISIYYIYIIVIIVDIDECVTGTHSCQQRCINTEGSYNCFCYGGFMKRFKIFCFGMLLYFI